MGFVSGGTLGGLLGIGIPEGGLLEPQSVLVLFIDDIERIKTKAQSRSKIPILFCFYFVFLIGFFTDCRVS